MGRWCSSVIAQSGAGRGKLPKAILYPWIPPHNLPPGNSVNSSTCSVSDLRRCQATTDLTLLAPPRSFWKIPIPDFQIVAIFITSDQVFSARAGVWKHEEQIRGSVWKQIWGTAARWAMTALVLSILYLIVYKRCSESVGCVVVEGGRRVLINLKAICRRRRCRQ